MHTNTQEISKLRDTYKGLTCGGRGVFNMQYKPTHSYLTHSGLQGQVLGYWAHYKLLVHSIK